MTYRRLGATGLHVSTISLGSWLTFGNVVDVDATRACVDAALEHGINLLDTADIYARGAAEDVLGKIIPDKKRSDLVLATKLFWPMSDDVNDRGLSRKHIIESCEKSLRRLNTEYIDVYQCHRYDPNTPIEEVVRGMNTLIEQGKVLYWGVSCWTAAQITEAVYLAKLMGCHPPISNQPHYSALYRKIEAEILPTCKRLGLGQIVWSPLEQGVLTGKYAKGAVPAGSRAANDKVNQFMLAKLNEDNLGKVESLRPIAGDLGCSVAQLALAWALRDDGIASTIIGATKAEQVVENAKAAEVTIPADAQARIEEILGNKPDPATGV